MPLSSDARQHGVDVLDHDGGQTEAQSRPAGCRSGFDISARPMATICCCPPDSEVDGACALVPAGSGTGRRPRPAIHGPGRATCAAEDQVFLDRQRREQPPPLGHQGDAALPRSGSAARPPIGSPFAARSHPGRARRPGRRSSCSSVDLARAIGADQRQHLALASAAATRRAAPGNRRRRTSRSSMSSRAQPCGVRPPCRPTAPRRWPAPRRGSPSAILLAEVHHDQPLAPPTAAHAPHARSRRW